MADLGERIAALETDMHTVKHNQDVMFDKLDSFGKWLIATAFSAAGGLLVMLLTIGAHKLGLL